MACCTMLEMRARMKWICQIWLNSKHARACARTYVCVRVYVCVRRLRSLTRAGKANRIRRHRPKANNTERAVHLVRAGYFKGRHISRLHAYMLRHRPGTSLRVPVCVMLGTD